MSRRDESAREVGRAAGPSRVGALVLPDGTRSSTPRSSRISSGASQQPPRAPAVSGAAAPPGGLAVGRRRLVPGGWRDLPEFCDATAAVSAATYGARRLPEIRALYRQSSNPCGSGSGSSSVEKEDDFGDLATRSGSNNGSSSKAVGAFFASRPAGETKLEDTLRSGGCKTSNRHLRRRATSHLSRKRHRFPAGAGSGSGSGSSRNGGGGECRPSARAASEEEEEEEGALPNLAAPRDSRRKRRRKREVICHGHEAWRGFSPGDEAAGAGHVQGSGSKAHWIPTHLWHAKRFRAESMFHWKIPVVHGNRGAKAAMRLAKEGKTLLQDATYARQPVRLDIPIQPPTDAIVRRIQRVLPNFRFNPRERRVVDGLLHHTDSFPLRPIGPVQWIVVPEPFLFREAIDDEQEHSGSQLAYLYLFVHASIRDEALECLQHWATLAEGPVAAAVWAQGVPGGMAWLRVRGANAVAALESATSALGFDSAPESNRQIIEANHGALLAFPCRPAAKPQALEACGVAYAVIHCPRNPDLPCNAGNVGLDVWCPPSLASKLLVALVVHGGACPIGLVEEAHLALEADPPIPLFPRDYVDTKAGTSYWAADAPEWRLYRSCLEAGSGRISVSDSGPAKFVNWPLMIPSSETDTAMVRGAFGLPFQQCFPVADPMTLPDFSSRRLRRPSRPPDALVHVPPLSCERMAQHRALCQALLDSLSLPTLILCHVQVHGKGKVVAGDTVFDFNSSPRIRRPLGRVTSGAFSPSRGAYHGLAVCGASRILETMLTARSFVRTDRVQHPRGRTCCLAVRVGNVSPKLEGSLSFLL